MAKSGMKGAGRGKRQREAEQAAQEKMTKQLKASAAAVEDLALTKLADMLRQRPRVTAHILRQLEMGCYDFFESDSPDTSAESLPQCVNMFHLLSKDMICKLLGDAVPALKTVIVGNLKVSKAKWVETFTFLLNVDPSSALPTRRIAKLSGWCAERAKRFGGRLPDAKEINDSMKLQDLMGFGYWTLEDEGTLQHVDGETVELPEELRVDMKCSSSESFWKAFCERGLIRATCADIARKADPSAWEKIDKPFFLKEMPKESDPVESAKPRAAAAIEEADRAPAVFETPEKAAAPVPNGGGGALGALGEIK